MRMDNSPDENRAIISPAKKSDMHMEALPILKDFILIKNDVAHCSEVPPMAPSSNAPTTVINTPFILKASRFLTLDFTTVALCSQAAAYAIP